MSNKLDISMLHQAARLAVQGHGRAEPNPMVGCIITNINDEIVGKGFHEKYGESHAEINALEMASNSAIGGTAYVTLEPCNHQGKTPPCSQALINSDIKRVVIGSYDPHEEASGGAEFLRGNGVEVEVIDDEICNQLIAPFAHRVKTGLPWITCKWAQTKDGCTETPSGESNWISCKESQQLVHEERGCVDAIVVGVGTVISDNPWLTVRGATKHRTPLRVVIDPNLRTPHESNVLNDESETLIAHAEDVDTSEFSFCKLLPLPLDQGVLDLKPLFMYLVDEYGATNIIVEGGATLFEHLFNQNLVNELWMFTSPFKSKVEPKINMSSLVDKISTQLINQQPCGVDTVQRFAVNPCNTTA